MSVELDLTEDEAVLLGCQKAAALEGFKKAMAKDKLELAIYYATWNFALDDQLGQAAPEEIMERIRTENEGGGKP